MWYNIKQRNPQPKRTDVIQSLYGDGSGIDRTEIYKFSDTLHVCRFVYVLSYSDKTFFADTTRRKLLERLVRRMGHAFSLCPILDHALGE